MSGLDAQRWEDVTCRVPKLVLCPDRRQCTDRRNGQSRGGRRLTDPPADLRSAVVARARTVPQQADWFGLWVAAAKLQATFRQMRLHMW